MAVHTSFADARANLADLMERAADHHETIIISRHGEPDVALIAADELASLQETAHLLRSPANAQRLLAAIQRSLNDEIAPQAIEALRTEVGLDGGA